jgi:hypothetical protein
VDRSPIAVYLDQWVWIELARTQHGRTAKPEAVEALEVLQQGVASGELIVPLSAVHYLETWHRSGWQSRHRLAAVMRDLSQWRALAPPEAVAKGEIAAAVASLCGQPSKPPDVFGIGVNHAFASATGRFRLVETVWTPESDEGRPVEDPDLFAEVQKRPEAWEWFSLAGPSEDFPVAELEGGLDWRPEHRRGDAWAAVDAVRAAKLEESHLWPSLRDALITEDFVAALLDDFNSAAEAYGLDPAAFAGGLRGGLAAFHDSLPSRTTLVSLQEARLKDRSRPTEQHDRTDLLGLMVAIPYCDVVVTERQWAHLATLAGLPDRFGTSVKSSLFSMTAVIRERLGDGRL